MGRLTAKTRKALPNSAFAGKKRSYPIQDKGHAQAAIARAKEFKPGDMDDIVSKARRVLGKGKGK